MVKLFSESGGVMRALLLDAEAACGLLVVTNFLDNSALRVDMVDVAGFATIGFFATTVFSGGAFCTRIPLTRLTGSALAPLFCAGFAATIFFGAGFLTTALRAALFGFAFATPFFDAAAFIDFFATTTDLALGAGLAVALRDPPEAARGRTFVRAGTCAVFARLPVFCLIFAISLAYLVTRRSRVIA